MFAEVYCIVTGRVQGVGYRDYVQNCARQMNLMGYVNNRNDGSVEVLAQGTPDELKQFVELLNAGSPLARIESVAVDTRTPAQRFDDFKVLF